MRAWIDTSKTCSKCGACGLQWRNLKGKWRLVDLHIGAAYIHNCGQRKI